MTADRQQDGPLPGLEGLLDAWTAALQGSTGTASPAGLAARLLDPRHWLGVGGAALEQPFEAVLGLPRLADVPDVDRKLLVLLQAWMGVAQRGAAYGTMVSATWMSAYAEFTLGLYASALEGKPVMGGRELLERWTALLNRRLLETQRSSEFLEAQRRLLDALLKSRAAEHELVEIGAKAADLPTRAELDDVHKTLHAVKRELRALQRRLAEAEEPAGESRQKRGAA